ncbi:MAG: VOC family protein [Desulfobacteraceae bacterium]|nr:VOC family protein [Desulfobacteraceae bacterium]
MRLKHVGLTSSSEETADTFYADLLGLTKSEPKALDLELSKAIFNVDSELVMVNYQNDMSHFEIFITGERIGNRRPIEHICLEIGNLEEFLEKCRGLNVDIARIPKGDKTLTFIKDFDGNLFEIKGG